MEQLIFPITKVEAKQTGKTYSSQENRNALFPTRLRELRAERRISQAALSEKLKMSKSTLGLYETGDTLPDAKIVRDLAVYFDVSADYLLGLSEVRYISPDIKIICKYTGLSDKAVDNLHKSIAVKNERGEYRGGYTDDEYNPRIAINALLGIYGDIFMNYMSQFSDGINFIPDQAINEDEEINNSYNRDDSFDYQKQSFHELSRLQVGVLWTEMAIKGVGDLLDDIVVFERNFLDSL